MTGKYQRKAHLAGIHCASASGNEPPTTKARDEFVALPLRLQCGACRRHLLERAALEQRLWGAA